MPHSPTRRTVLLSTGAAALVAGCGGEGGEGDASAASPGRELAPTSDIPVGGGRIFPDEKIVVTQPEQGEFKAFSAVCTHQNCLVSDVRDGTVDCACHGSRFSITDGAVERGPATRPLPEERIAVRGNSVRLA
ncbi:Rieske (2Fe-2S) protein [Streptomyces pactum]|uniref:Cytochrome bc1 complex Rieske iron-sulfur subunit n=1 Tax=Streptomyces pactum TaxID=68249 RepID=A0A1S6JEZ9_9ACTN|nr:Rieske (2Fe-2S) protein [Streptomyces pactum]AQS70340.1 iron-sulfur protein [Streptomyces pactum]